MKIIVDAFGGDHAPLAVIEGCRQAVDELGAEILLTGDEEKIRQAAAPWTAWRSSMRRR